VDDIQITDTTTGKLVAAEDAELVTQGPGPGLQLSCGSVVTDPALVLAGKTAIQLSNWQSVVTNPAVVPLASWPVRPTH